ncbi:MAG: glycosyltransferase [Thermoguttaceae bacterium]
MPDASILLGTCEGAAYLPELIESIRGQSETRWTLWTRDDDSSDASPEILRRAAAADPRVVILQDQRGRLGPAGNYGLLAQRAHDAGAQYQFFADQDDVWHADKLRKQIVVMERAQRAYGAGTPHLVYSDVTVVDERLRLVHPSFLAASRLVHGEGRPLATLLGRNFVPGCACMINRHAAELALPIPETAASPDWWVALATAAAGRISYLDEPTVEYRRHAYTVSGPAAFWSGFNPLRYSWPTRWQTGLVRFRQSIVQARILRDRLRDRKGDSPHLCAAPSGPFRQMGTVPFSAAADEEFDLLVRFCEVFERPEHGLARIRRLRRLGVPAIDRVRRLIYYVCVLRLGRSVP